MELYNIFPILASQETQRRKEGRDPQKEKDRQKIGDWWHRRLACAYKV